MLISRHLQTRIRPDILHYPSSRIGEDGGPKLIGKSQIAHAAIILQKRVSLASRPEELSMHPDVLPCAPVDVLIADDDAQLRGYMRFMLETQGLTCAEAA